MKRLILDGYRSSDTRITLDVYLKCDDGIQYVWTPDWERETRQLFLEGHRLEELSRTQSVQMKQPEETPARVPSDREPQKETVNIEVLAFQAGEALRRRASLDKIQNVASRLFAFEIFKHPNSKITDIKSQKIYDCIMTLSEQPYTRERKLVLMKKFIAYLAPARHPMKTLA